MNTRLAFLITWLACFLTFFWRFAPTGELSGEFSSDAAIPVIMANQPRLSWYEFYYHGQDRFGGFTSALGWVVQQVFQVHWTPTAAFVLNALILSLGVVALCAAAFRDRPTLPLAPCAAAFISSLLLCRFESIENWVLSTAHPYAAGVGLASVAIAAIADCCREKPSLSRRVAPAAISFLACWLTPMSLPMLLMAWVPLSLRAGGRPLVPGTLLTALLILSGFGIERLVRLTYVYNLQQTYANEMLGQTFRPITDTSIDVQRLPQSAQQLFQRLRRRLSSYEWNLVLPGFLLIAPVCWIWWTQRSTREPIDVAGPMILACLAAALGNFTGAALASWSRLNDYPLRYLVPTVAFMIIAASIGVVYVGGLLAALLTPQMRTRAMAVMAVVGGVCAATMPRANGETFRQMHRTAQTLADNESRVVVFGRYWGSYVWQGLNPYVLAVPLEGQWTRNPGAIRDLPNYQNAFLCAYAHEPPAPAVLEQFHTSWRRTARPPVESPLCNLFEYRSENATATRPLLPSRGGG
ncbi:MAG: hypothetical protein ACRD2N_19560 [Vicinamibacterales bacterium]